MRACGEEGITAICRQPYELEEFYGLMGSCGLALYAGGDTGGKVQVSR